MIFLVEGREAIPVRAIPLMTVWETLSADRLANWLSHCRFSTGHHTLFAWRMEDDVPTKIAPNWWRNFCVEQFGVLDRQIRSETNDEAAGYQRWQRESISVLPAGTFVWRDEFEAIYNRRFNLDASDDEACEIASLAGVQHGKGELDFNPFIADEAMRLDVIEGIPESVTAPNCINLWPWGAHHTQMLGHLDAAARRFWVGYDPVDISTANTNTTVTEWLQHERGVSGKMAEAIATMLRPDNLRTGPR